MVLRVADQGAFGAVEVLGVSMIEECVLERIIRMGYQFMVKVSGIRTCACAFATYPLSGQGSAVRVIGGI
jgi:hypothetical protein